MRLIDGRNAVLGRLASYAAKEALRGEDIVILNCEEVIVTGRKKRIRKDFREKRSRVGSSQKGPKIARSSHMIVKRAIRGMLPDYRKGRGRIAWKKIRCHNGVPKEFEEKKKIIAGRENKSKFIFIKEISK